MSKSNSAYLSPVLLYLYVYNIMHKMKPARPWGDQRGFSLMELLIVMLVINVLAAIAITLIVGSRDKARRAVIIRTASSASDDIQLWLQSSFSSDRNIREHDTNFDGKINSGDLTNEELLVAGVALTYTTGRNAQGDASPWFTLPMWSTDPLSVPNGRISLIQNNRSQIQIIGKGKTGVTLFEKILSAN